LAGLDKAHRPGREKRTKTSVGDIVLDYKGELLTVTGMLPKPPTPPTLKIKGQTITLAWSQERSDDEALAIPTTGFIVHFCRRPNPFKDGAFPHVTENEAFEEVHCEASEMTVVIDKFAYGAPLSDDCDYEVRLSVETIVGRSDWSKPVVGRTLKLPSVASKMMEFYLVNHAMLSVLQQGVTPWELYQSGGKKTLFLGLTVEAERPCTDSRFKTQLAVRLVDVAAEFEPHILAAHAGDRDKTIVVVFVGSSGYGKSTQINAFVSYLLGGEADDLARIMVIDDRGANQAQSVTQHITCYRIRPLSSRFGGKTLLIVDTPGYGDARGFERDAFVTAAMSEFFKTIGHVNAIIFTCRANEARTTFLSPVSTYIFSLFAKDVQSCLRTIYTFSDAGNPLARGSLRALQWPVENGEVEVNNAAFTIELDAQNAHKVRDWWLMSVKSQFRVMRMLLCMPPVPTAASAFVTQDRLELERKCELAEKKILRTANDAQNLIANMGALAKAVGAASGEKILVEEDRSVAKPVLDGMATTLCLACNWTCHEICTRSDDDDKKYCCVMSDGNCIVCKGRCHWSKHKNAKHIIVTEKHSEWVVPEDLIKRWNANNNTLEGALLDVMDAYLELQEELRKDILYLAQLTEKLMNTALLHDPSALINYIETLIQTSRARGGPPEQLMQLTTAKNTLILVREVKERGVETTFESQILLQIIRAVRTEMHRRKELKPRDRAREEEKPCNLYNDLREKLPPEIQKKAPELLRKEGYFFSGAYYPENLQAIVKLVQVVLRDGGVVAALAASH
jgi:50S ribosome-binding GTPase